MAMKKPNHSKNPQTGQGKVDRTPHAAPGYVPTVPKLGPGPAEPASLPGAAYLAEQQQK